MAVTFTSEVHIAAPPQEFCAAFQDVAGWSRWMKGLEGAEMLTPGDFGVGTRWRETRRMVGHLSTELFEVVGWDPPRAIELFVDGTQGTTGKGAFRFRYDLEPQGEQTRVRMRGEIDMPGWFAGAMSWLFVGVFKRACDRDLLALKEHVEASRRG